ncbi:putative ABC transport system substrate-binding protein [Duganella sacchari]|uniref:Putative ABC transport system substrate-binding protein n=1 Tax=Duganella sacchari TaxID=551987 RepID=A0A1M7L0C9_9BURK|nr:ABC transporter substrate binding protein [Duganella sacchari]SHM71264.1 putative ABC transport system substrate-binding protein [Duganella sacchari]
MQKTFATALLALAAALPAHAFEPLPAETMDDTRVFKVEVLQVTDIEPYRDALNGFLKSLRASGLVDGKNLSVHKSTIDFDVENGGFWSKLGVLLRIRQEASRIVEAKPDLVLTIGTPATKYARGMMADAHIPLVFTAVANPEDAGCVSLVDAGEGATGSTLYTDMTDSLKLVKDVFPSVRRIGMVHTDDENGVANVAAATVKGKPLGLEVSARLVNKSDHIAPSLKELHAGGVDMFAVPLDTYYGLHRYEAAMDLGDFGIENKVPVVTLAMVRVPGAALYVGADFKQVGQLAGTQAAKILQRHTKPDVLPILRQSTPTVLIDPARLAALQVSLPPTLAARKKETANGFWQIDLTQ